MNYENHLKEFIEPSYSGASSAMSLIFISYFTPEYEQEAIRLRESLHRFNLPYRLQRIRSQGSWWENIHFRAGFLAAMLDQYRPLPICWLDSDAVVQQYPELLFRLEREQSCDLAAHYFRNRELLGGTLWLRNSDRVRELIDRWQELDLAERKFKEQFNLQRVVERDHFNLYRLPPAYTQIFDLMKKEGAPIIEHFQASRYHRLKSGSRIKAQHILRARARLKKCSA